MTALLRCDLCGRIETSHPAEICYNALGWTSCWPKQIEPGPLAKVLYMAQPDDRYALDLCPGCKPKVFRFDLIKEAFEPYGRFGPPPTTHLHSVFGLKELEGTSPYRQITVVRGPSPSIKLLRYTWLALLVLLTFWQAHMFFRWFERALVTAPTTVTEPEQEPT